MDVATVGAGVAVWNLARQSAPSFRAAMRRYFGWASVDLNWPGDLELSSREWAAVDSFVTSTDSEAFFRAAWVENDGKVDEESVRKILKRGLKEHCLRYDVVVSALEPKLWENYRARLGEVQPDSDSPRTVPRSTVQRYIEFAMDPSRVAEANRTLSFLIDSPPPNAPAFLAHIDAEDVKDPQSVYIQREVTFSDDRRAALCSMFTPGTPRRIVLLGDPGVGKTTLVEHLASLEVPDSMACVVLRLRDVSASRSNLLEAAAAEISTSVHERIDDARVKDILDTGSVIAVFDGLDEIANVEERRKVAGNVVRFADAHPLCSIIVTSRTRGYGAAKVDSGAFEVASLAEYSEKQVVEYVRGWFAQAGRPDAVVESFLRESETVDDIRSNPLMLSLLCSLYRVTGQIPNNRRDIYAQCADLLFVKWDRHRQIVHESSEPSYAGEMMNDIASLFYRSQTARGGVQYRQLLKMLSQFIENYVGASPERSEGRARDFLEFCAGRAWLLARNVDEDGNYIYTFTHRTFYEYFAAESIARSSENASQLVDEIVRTHSADETSVIPELMIQAYERARSKGATAAYKELVSRRASTTLAFRLMSTNLQAHVRDQAFQAAVNSWSGQKEVPFEHLELVFQLPPDPKDQFVRAYLAEESVVQSLFAEACTASALALRGPLRTSISGRDSRASWDFPTAIYDLLSTVKARQLESRHILPLMLNVVREEVTWGCGIHSLLGTVDFGLAETDVDYIADFLSTQWRMRCSLNGRLLELIHGRFPEAVSLRGCEYPELSGVRLEALAGWVMCLYESGLRNPSLVRELPVYEWFDHRVLATQRAESLEPGEVTGKPTPLHDGTPKWVLQWATGEKRLLGRRKLTSGRSTDARQFESVFSIGDAPDWRSFLEWWRSDEPTAEEVRDL